MADQGEMIGLEDYPDFRIQGNWGYYTVWARTARGLPGQPDTWAELAGRFQTTEEALANIRARVAEQQMGGSANPDAGE